MEDIDLHKRLKKREITIPFVADAKVYHPPRRIQSPKMLAMAQESHLYCLKKNNLPIISCRRLLIATSYHRLIPIRDRKKNWDSLIALKEWIQQISYTWYFYHFHWKKKYGKK
jgi:hypothetical protein